jgi:uncharacterized HAD superfamily protein
MTPNPANKPVIAVDIDDVLAANAEGFIEFSNRKWGTSLTPDDYDEHWAEMWSISSQEAEQRREVILQEQLFVKHKFFNEAKPALNKLKENYNFVVVTSRGPRIQKDTISWINKEYGALFEDILFLQIWDDKKMTLQDKLKFTKLDLLQQAGAQYLIDDHPKHCIAAAQAGIKAILFGDYGWNRQTKLIPNMVRAKNWQEVLEYFHAQ